MVGEFLALDPGTYKTGVALFRGEALADWWLVEARRGDPVEVRVAAIVDAVNAVANCAPEISEVVCERTTAIEKRQPAPELQVLSRRLRSWAKRVRRLGWTDYHPSTVVSHIRPRAITRTTPQKEVLRLGVFMVYRDTLARDGKRLVVGDLDQNVVDAVAVGHCHLSHRRAAALAGPGT